MTSSDINTTKTTEPATGADLLQNIGGYAIPIDPMDDLHCDSCQ